MSKSTHVPAPAQRQDRTDELLMALDRVGQRLRYLAADANMPAARMRREILWCCYEAEAAAIHVDDGAPTVTIPDDEMVDLSVRPNGTPTETAMRKPVTMR